MKEKIRHNFTNIIRRFKYLVTFCTLILLAACSGNDNDIVLKVNDRAIRLDEFESRLNNIPQTLNAHVEKLKENLLSSLIAECVLANEAANLNLDTLDRVRLLKEEYRDEALYEEWMTKEIQGKVKVSDEEIKSAYPRFFESRNVEYWVLPDSASARELTNKLNKSDEVSVKPEQKQIVFAESLPKVEDVVYGLQVGGISDPVFVDSSYYVFKLVSVESVEEYKKYGFNTMRPEIEKRIKTRKQNNLADVVLSGLMEDKEFTVNRDAYNFLFQQIYYTLYDHNRLKYNKPEMLQLELFLKEVNPNNDFNQTLIEFNNGSNWSVMDCWNLISVSPYPLNYKNPADLQTGLFDVLRRIILLRSIAANARSKGMENAEHVKEQSSLWTDNVLAQALISQERSSIETTEDELINLYDSTKYNFMKPAKRRIIPVIVRNKTLADKLYDRLIKGANIISISKKYSMNKVAVKGNSPGMFITENMWGEIGKKVFTMKVGDISKPIPGIDSTFAVVKLLETNDAEPYTYDELHSRLNTFLVDSKLQKTMEALLAEKINNYDIYINRDLLGKAKYYGGNMGVKKTHFPLRGAVPNFPLFDADAEWYQSVAKHN